MSFPIRYVVAGVAALLAFSPLQLPGAPAAVAGAECTTCCPQEGPKCVVCSTKCETVDNAYDRGAGACPVTKT